MHITEAKIIGHGTILPLVVKAVGDSHRIREHHRLRSNYANVYIKSTMQLTGRALSRIARFS